jgi:phosphopantothenoylcysteine decarboxylase/phosphopantothenate--cysteine ligase
LAAAALALGHEVTVLSGPVEVEYPAGATVVDVISTEEMLEHAQRLFGHCAGAIGAAAPCDYRPVRVATRKISKNGEPLQLQLVETPDVVASLGAAKRADQWVVGFALETEDQRFRATVKLERKSCDLMVLNGPEAMNSLTNSVELIAPNGQVVGKLQGDKQHVADGILDAVQQRLIQRQPPAVNS